MDNPVIHAVTNSPKLATAVAATTTSLGILEWIPDDIGKLATLIGVILSAVLIWVQITALRRGLLELKIMRSKERARRAELAARAAAGLPTRRGDDTQ